MERRELLKRMALALGYTVSAPVVGQLLISCESQPKIFWKPTVLSLEQAASLESICEFILPSTDTPGAKSVGVPQFIDSMVGVVMNDKERIKFINELNVFLDDCEEHYGDPFEACSLEDQRAFLDHHEANIPKQYPRIWGAEMVKSAEKNFFGKLKELVVWGYFSSEEVGEQVLSYLPIPGKYESCKPLSEVGRAWSIS